MSCGARLAPFDIKELREITAYDELELDTLGDKKTALFLTEYLHKTFKTYEQALFAWKKVYKNK